MLHLCDSAGMENFSSGQFCKVQAVSGQENMQQWILSALCGGKTAFMLLKVPAQQF